MQIENIIFDLGGVIMNIEMGKDVTAFARLCGWSEEKMRRLFEENKTLMHDFEVGAISEADFRRRLTNLMGMQISDSDFDMAWNAILFDVPRERIEALKKLSRRYRLFLLSNTNVIHIRRLDEVVKEAYGDTLTFSSLFKKIYYSHEARMRKPDVEIYQYVLSENNLKPQKTLFIDDLEENLEGAAKAGIQVIRAERNRFQFEILTYG